MDAQKPQAHQIAADLIVAHPLPARPSRYRTVLDAARARDAAQPRSARTVPNHPKTTGAARNG